MPNKARNVSVSRIENRERAEVEEEGRRVVREHKIATTLYGWASISTQAVQSTGLQVLDDDNPPGHSSIIGWPEDESEWPLYQQQLAELATGTRLDPPITVSYTKKN